MKKSGMEQRMEMYLQNVELGTENKRLNARIAALEAALEAKHQQYTGAVIQLTEARHDDTELDATDAAKPAWWRGYDYGVAEICLAAFKAITGEEAKTPVTWQVLKDMIAARGAK